jgi:hypothetical protein
MARQRDVSVASSCSVMTGDEDGAKVHNFDRIKMMNLDVAPLFGAGGGGCGRFGIYQGNWGGYRKDQGLLEMTNWLINCMACVFFVPTQSLFSGFGRFNGSCSSSLQIGCGTNDPQAIAIKELIIQLRGCGNTSSRTSR